MGKRYWRSGDRTDEEVLISQTDKSRTSDSANLEAQKFRSDGTALRATSSKLPFGIKKKIVFFHAAKSRKPAAEVNPWTDFGFASTAKSDVPANGAEEREVERRRPEVHRTEEEKQKRSTAAPVYREVKRNADSFSLGGRNEEKRVENKRYENAWQYRGSVYSRSTAVYSGF